MDPVYYRGHVLVLLLLEVTDPLFGGSHMHKVRGSSSKGACTALITTLKGHTSASGEKRHTAQHVSAIDLITYSIQLIVKLVDTDLPNSMIILCISCDDVLLLILTLVVP